MIQSYTNRVRAFTINVHKKFVSDKSHGHEIFLIQSPRNFTF